MTEPLPSDQRPDDDEIIELTDVAEEQPDDDEIIELTDVAAEPTDDDEIIELTDFMEDSSGGDDVIELTDSVEDVSENGNDIAAEAESDDAYGLVDAAGETAIGEIDEPEPADREDDGPLLDFPDEDDYDNDDDDFVGNLGMEIGGEEDEEDSGIPSDSDTAVDAAQDAGADEPLAEAEKPAGDVDLFAVSPEQIEMALEKVNRNLFYEKIDKVITKVVEREVTKEIDKIKRILLEEVADEEY